MYGQRKANKIIFDNAYCNHFSFGCWDSISICLYQENAKGDRFHQKSCQLYSLSRKRPKYFIIEIIKIYFLVMLFGVKITITLTDILIFL